MDLSLEEAVQRVKAEIIAPDWRLNRRRIESLEEAFACLQKRFRNRKGIHAILTMAGSVLKYIKTKGDHSPPHSVDFLKEAMADVINLYEETDYDPEREEKVLKKAFAHFQKLKEKIKSHRDRSSPPGPLSAPGAPASRPAADVPASTEGELQMFRVAAEEKMEAAASLPAEAARLLAELNRTLERADEIRATLQAQLQAAAALGGKDLPEELATVPSVDAAADNGDAPTSLTANGVKFSKCPPTALREINIGEQHLGLPEENIALLRPLGEAARENYLREGQVPLRDFGRWFSGLARQFKGMLSTIPDRKLKKLCLPVISMQAFNLPELPDAQATTLLVLSYGHWHGVLVCTRVQEELRTMIKFRKHANGDIAGVGCMEGGGEVPVANVADLLRREGFLAII